MRENRLSGSEGGGVQTTLPTPIQGWNAQNELLLRILLELRRRSARVRADP